MTRILLVCVLLLCSCSHHAVTTEVKRTSEYQQEIETLLEIDKKHKLLEEQYLREIAIAQNNDDHDAYKFYIVEYVKIPRIPIPEWAKKEPGFYPRKSAADVMRELHMEQK